MAPQRAAILFGVGMYSRGGGAIFFQIVELEQDPYI